jgi:hypothetical protein
MSSITPQDTRHHSGGISELQDYAYLTGINIHVKYNNEFREMLTGGTNTVGSKEF